MYCFSLSMWCRLSWQDGVILALLFQGSRWLMTNLNQKLKLLMKTKKIKKPLTIDQKISRRNFISFGVFSAAGLGGALAWKWLYNSPIETITVTGGARKPLRRALNKTELAFRKVFSNNNLVKTYPKSMAAKKVRVNSDIGIEANKKFDPATWKLQVVKKPGEV